MTQENLRKELRAIRRNILNEQRETLSRQLVSQVLTYLDDVLSVSLNNLRIATFVSMPEEIDTHHLNNALLGEELSLFLPVVVEPKTALQFAPYHTDTELMEGALSIPIPNVPKAVYINGYELDICLVPLVGFDMKGSRIGMGGGFYDRTFAFLNSSAIQRSALSHPYLLGIAYDEQKVDTIAQNEWDVKLDGVITPTMKYTFT